MRVGSVALFTGVAMGVAALAAAAGGAGVGSLDSAAMTRDAAIGRTFAGAGRGDGTDDPDLPIATARYGEEPTGAALMNAEAGDAYRTVGAGAPPPVLLANAAPVTLREVSEAPRQRMALTLAGGPVGDWPIGAPPRDRQSSHFTGRNGAAPSTPKADSLIDAKALMVRFGPTSTDAKRGRWFIFAAGSGKAFGLNMVRDPVAGWRRAGWSVERLAEFGKIQLGLGWRKGPTQVSVAASRREIGAYGISREDTVIGLSFSVKPGK
ncbi:MAG: hypothetical protein JWP35_648 [Caulobacter sp.]|nr:hypothetical protein [Caulobacter sp.]